MAGVSAGTVDRVLHNRGDVSAASREKVQKVLDEIDYHPNMFAIGLAAKKRYRVLCIIPYYVEHDYWHSVAEGINRAAQELRPFNVSVDFLCYHHADRLSYEKACAKLRKEIVDAVLIAPNFREETMSLTSYLEGKKRPYAFVDFNIEDTHALCYIGQDSQTSGYMAAKILMRKYKEGQELILFLNNKKNSPAEIQMQRRMDGFMNFIAQEHENLVVHDVVLNKEDDEANRRTLEDFFAAHPKAVLGAVFNSRVYQVAGYRTPFGRTSWIRPSAQERGVPEIRRSKLSHRTTTGTARILWRKSSVRPCRIQTSGDRCKVYAYRHPDERKHQFLF